MSTRYLLGDHYTTARQLALLLRGDPAQADTVARALEHPRPDAPETSTAQLEAVMDRLAREDTSDATRRDRLIAACRDLADALAAHNQTAHTVAACTWGLNSALNQYKETQP